MQENEFEKQVQQKMEELKLRPAAEVWNAVVVTIAKQKRRRRAILFSVALLCFLLGGTLLLSTNTTKIFFKTTNDISANTSTIKNNNSPNNNANTGSRKEADAVNKTSSKQDVVIENTSIVTSVDSIKADNIKVKSINGQKENDVNTSLVVSNNDQKKTSSIHYELIPSQPINKKKKHSTKGKISFTTSAGAAEEIENEIAIENENIIDTATKQVAVVNNDTATLKNIAKKLADTLPENKNNTVSASNKISKNKKSKWMFGVALAAGNSSTAAYHVGLFNLNSYSADYLSAAPSTGSGSNGTVNNGGVYTPSKINRGTAFSLGFTTSYKLSKKTNLLTAVNYKLLTTSHSVGNDSSANNVISFAAGYKTTYNNNYHFIEIPIIFQTEIFTIKKHSVNLETGLSISQLISTNSLQFNSSTSKYYVDNKLFNKTIIGLSLGLSFNFSSANKAPFLIGPQVNYGFTTVAGTGLYAKKNYGFAGIRLQKMFKKN